MLQAFPRSRGLPTTEVATDLEFTALGAGTVAPAVPSRLTTYFAPFASR